MRNLPSVPIPHDWPRRLPVRVVRRLLQSAAIGPLLRAQLQLDVGSGADIPATDRPMVIVANHASRLDIPVVMAALPRRQRRRTATTPDESTRQDESTGRYEGTGPDALLDNGWNVLLFPEGACSQDGVVGDFNTTAAELALKHRVPVLPVGIRGTYAAMPPGQNWPGGRLLARDRHRVAVRFATPLHAEVGESAASFTERIAASVRTAIAEDRTTWWQSRRGVETASGEQPPVGSWRRIWEQSQSPKPGGRPRRPRIWRR